MAVELRDAFKFTSSEVHTMDFAKMRDESFEIAKGVYDGLTSSKDFVLPDSYIKKYAPIAKRRASLAGHRLAFFIESVFGDKGQNVTTK